MKDRNPEQVTELKICTQCTMHPFEQIITTDSVIKTKIENDMFAKELYAALCNIIWKNSEEEYSCTWRYAGELVASLRDKNEDYMDFYCSGNEGIISENVKNILTKYNWIPEKA